MNDLQTSSSEERACSPRVRRLAVPALIAVLLLVAIACDRPSRSLREETVAEAVSTANEVPMRLQRGPVASSATRNELTQVAPVDREEQQPILRVALFIDQSESMDRARVPHVTHESLVPLLGRLQVSGGELAIGLIRDRSDAPLARVFVPAPPLAPVFPQTERPNIFEKARERKREDEEQARYDVRLREWKADAAARINAFVESTVPLLEAAADAPATDIHSALLRANVFVSEPNAFGRPVMNVVILLTDGVETVDTETRAQFSAPAELLVVNGTGTVGNLDTLHPVRFEALDAAIRYVVDGGSHVRR